MVTPRKVYDFCEQAESEKGPSQKSMAGPRGDFFIDGWDAYERWLDTIRDDMDSVDERPD